MVSYQLTAFISLALVCTCSNAFTFEAPKCIIRSYCGRDNAIVKLVPQKPFNGLIGTDVENPECKLRFKSDEKSILFDVNFKNCTLGSNQFVLHVYSPIMLTEDFGFRGPALISEQVTC
ncbi:uncharacterized protein LOC123261222 [Cotesia glomerata]|uniref:ZP domain-containing protein n=1 Tax=Cotesia glomerata TaxID=32391 RepID=A0AAV7ID87_COTGL|nr:uncharacterized protein LOC123261222 [Cotesia glomerata]KAH0549087.1 hypothetical protein KQX54_005954 [Cotesia glomerata]